MKQNIAVIKEKIIRFLEQRKRLVAILSVGLAAVLIAGLVIGAGRSANADDSLTYVAVIRGDLTESIDLVGTLKAQPSASLTWQSNGTVAEYNLAVGTSVSKADILLSLESSSQSDASLNAQSDLLDAQLTLAQMKQADSDFQEALKAVSDAEWNLIMARSGKNVWYDENAVSEERLEGAIEAYELADQRIWALEAEYESLKILSEPDDPSLQEKSEELADAQFERDKQLRLLNQILGHPYDLNVETDFIEYNQAKAEVEQARAAYQRLLDNSQELAAAQAVVDALQNTVNQANIIAPFDGTVTDILVRPGDAVSEGTSAVQMDDLSNLHVDVNVSELQVSQVRIGQSCVITFDALPYQKYTGSVVSIANAGQESSGVVEFRITVRLENPDPAVKPGFTTQVNILTNQLQDVLLVPSQAVVSNGSRNIVMLADGDGGASPIIVDVGAASEAYIQIISTEIEEGDQIGLIPVESRGFEEMRGMMRVMGGGMGGPPPEGGGGDRPPNQ